MRFRAQVKYLLRIPVTSYQLHTSYKCGTGLRDEYKYLDGDEDVCKACWDGTTNEVTCEACCRTLSDQGTIYNEREIYPEEET